MGVGGSPISRRRVQGGKGEIHFKGEGRVEGAKGARERPRPSGDGGMEGGWSWLAPAAGTTSRALRLSSQSSSELTPAVACSVQH